MSYPYAYVVLCFAFWFVEFFSSLVCYRCYHYCITWNTSIQVKTMEAVPLGRFQKFLLLQLLYCGLTHQYASRYTEWLRDIVSGYVKAQHQRAPETHVETILTRPHKQQDCSGGSWLSQNAFSHPRVLTVRCTAGCKAAVHQGCKAGKWMEVAKLSSGAASFPSRVCDTGHATPIWYTAIVCLPEATSLASLRRALPVYCPWAHHIP